MATLNATADLSRISVPASSLLVGLPSLPQDVLDQVVRSLDEAFVGRDVLALTPDAENQEPHAVQGRVALAGFTPVASPAEAYTLTAAGFLNAYEAMRRYQAQSMLLLGPETQTLTVTSLHALAERAATADLTVPRYLLPARSGLINSAILYPLTRALFGTQPRFPLAIDLGLSARMAERMAMQAQRSTAAGQNDALLWPVSEAATAGYSIAEAEDVERALPVPATQDLSSILGRVAGSLFADIEQKAVYWQRARTVPAERIRVQPAENGTDDIQPLLDTFRLAHGNLHEIWSLVLPPQSLLGLKRLSTTPAESFVMPEALWARIVYDFVLAHRLRTINRGHLLGALTPLYLAWVASYLRATAAGLPPERHVEATVAAFEADKAYLVSRWRWPDRFNP